MINNFTSVITWFKDISSSLLSWFFDTSNVNKVLLFIVPLFVIGAIFVLFDFIIPMFYDLPQWKLKRQIAVMTPKNTYGLQVNKHLIPRKMYSLRGMFMSRFSGGSIKAYNSKTLKSWSTKDIKPFQTKDIKGFKTNDIKSFKTNDMKSFKINDLRSFKTSDIRSFKTSDIRSFKIFDIRSLKSGDVKVFRSFDLKTLGSAELRSFTPEHINNFSIKPISTIKLGGLNPAEIRSFKVSEIRPLGVRSLRAIHLNSRVVGSHLIDSHSIGALSAQRNHISGNNIRVATPSYKINNSFELTTLGKKVVNDWKEGSKFMEEQSFEGATMSGDAPTSSVSEGDAGSYGSW